MDRKVAIRFGTEGKAQIVADLGEIGTSGDAAFNRVAKSDCHLTIHHRLPGRPMPGRPGC